MSCLYDQFIGFHRWLFIFYFQVFQDVIGFCNCCETYIHVGWENNRCSFWCQCLFPNNCSSFWCPGEKFQFNDGMLFFLWPALHCITMSVRVLCACAEFCLLSKNKSDCCTLHLLAVSMSAAHISYHSALSHRRKKKTPKRAHFRLHLPTPHLLRLDNRSSPRTPSKQVCTESQLTAVAHEHSYISIERKWAPHPLLNFIYFCNLDLVNHVWTNVQPETWTW